MRVLQLGPYPPPHGGVQSNLVALREFLRKQHIPCAVINITRHRKPEADEVYYPESASEVLQLLLRLRYDIVHLHIGGMLNTRLLALAYVCALLPGRKSVMTFHSGGYPSTPQGQAARPMSLSGFIFRRLDAIIGVNPQIMEFFGKLGVSAKRTHLIYPHALLTDALVTNLPSALETFFQQHRPLLISVGLLEPEYDLNLQIDVLGNLRQRFPLAGLVMIGSGSLDDQLRLTIQSKPYAEHILLAGDVSHQTTLEAIRQSDLMLRTTLYDGDAVSVREALYFGTPVIATDNGMRPTGVRLIAKCDLQGLEQAAAEMLNKPRTPRPTAKSDESNLRAVLELYLELTGQKQNAYAKL